MTKQCATCGDSECLCDGITCDYCGQNGRDVEIYHQCPTLGTICTDCEGSGEYPDFWEPENDQND